MNNQGNGKVNILGPNITTKFSMMDKIPINTNSNYLNSLTHINIIKLLQELTLKMYFLKKIQNLFLFQEIMKFMGDLMVRKKLLKIKQR